MWPTSIDGVICAEVYRTAGFVGQIRLCPQNNKPFFIDVVKNIKVFCIFRLWIMNVSIWVPFHYFFYINVTLYYPLIIHTIVFMYVCSWAADPLWILQL